MLLAGAHLIAPPKQFHIRLAIGRLSASALPGGILQKENGDTWPPLCIKMMQNYLIIIFRSYLF